MTNGELAILGLVVERPMYGYEIEQVIEQRTMRNWTEIGFSSIYYLLKKLQTEGLVDSRVDTSRSKGPARKVFGATRKGRSAWKRETRRALATPRRQFPDIYLGMAGMPGLEPEQAIEALDEHLKGLEDRTAEIMAARERSGLELPYHVEAMFTYGETMIEAERTWVIGFIEELTAMKKEPT